MLKSGTSTAEFAFPLCPDKTFSILFSNECFQQFQESQNRIGIKIAADWTAEGNTTYRRRSEYSFKESIVLRQGASLVSVAETSQRVANGWSVTSQVDTTGGPLANSTKVSAKYSIAPTTAGSHIVCTVVYQYDLTSVSWLLRSAVDKVVEREMTGLPQKLFAFTSERQGLLPKVLPRAVAMAELESGGLGSSGSGRFSPSTVCDSSSVQCGLESSSGSSATPASVPNSEVDVEEARPLVVVANAVHSVPAMRSPTKGVEAKMRAVEVPVSPSSSSSQRASRKRVRALLLLVLIVVFWLFSALVGSVAPPKATTQIIQLEQVRV